jgi:hypothetical protein
LLVLSIIAVALVTVTSCIAVLIRCVAVGILLVLFLLSVLFLCYCRWRCSLSTGTLDDGSSEGTWLGGLEGKLELDWLGFWDDISLGFSDGCSDGLTLGLRDGASDRDFWVVLTVDLRDFWLDWVRWMLEGRLLGIREGDLGGDSIGFADGISIGLSEGCSDGF